jgi:aerobic-type carbon monoxide dehydrogenase small subunit (CoxS/CutS family)
MVRHHSCDVRHGWSLPVETHPSGELPAAGGPPGTAIAVTVNGERRTVQSPPARPVLEVLRDELGLTGTKEGCSVGVCGACSILVDGRLMSACLVPVGMVADREVTTVEGLADGDRLSPVQQAFLECGGFQCGICTPGQVVAATSLLAECPKPTPHQVRDYMMGNICRCTGYYSIVNAVLTASGQDPVAEATDEGAAVEGARA